MEIRFPLLLDGAMGTELQKRGFTGDIPSEKWAIDHPDDVIDIQRKYIDAGSEVIYAPTFSANRAKLEASHIFGQVEEYNKTLVEISREAAQGRALVAGDMSPIGAMIYPLGDARFEELVEIYTEQAAALEKAGVDLFVLETMTTLPEARAALLAVKSVSTKPVLVSFTCDETGRTMTGTDVTAALQVIQGMGADLFGLNCSVGPDLMLEQIRRLRSIARIPLAAKPNAGLPVTVDGKLVYPCQAAEFASYTVPFAEAGVEIFGGCCGTDASHIRALADALRGVPMRDPAPENTDLLPCATEKQAVFLPADTAPGEVLACDEELEDALDEEEDRDAPVTTIDIRSREELSNFEDAQVMITKPLVIRCSDAGILEKALRLYQGRALYDGLLSEEELAPLVKKYGLII
ncbi:MAG: homocysteine S-methyltransferase family protein [Anaerovoracaceae bacterium]|jgi:methionine synthase I (cobalamin-dependent)